MTIIVITLPHFFEGETDALNALFQAGLETLHLRKPQATLTQVKNLLHGIRQEYHARIVTHEHFELAAEYGLKGIHLNGRNPEAPQEYNGHISCSCHSLHEAAVRKEAYAYVFLSPIYHSISKEGYASAFTTDELRKAAQEGIIDHRIVALGGITPDRLKQVKTLGFGGAAVLGDLWNHLHTDLVPYYLHLKSSAQ